MSRSPAHCAHDDLPLAVLPGKRVGDAREPSAVELAEALLGTAHAFKHWGNLCFAHVGMAPHELSAPRGHRRRLSLPRGRLLVALWDAGQARVRMGDLAAALGVTARNITTIVDGLEREGLVARRPDPTDRRAIVLQLTPDGQAHMEQVHALRCDLAEQLFALLSADERRVLYALLARLGQRAAHSAGVDASSACDGEDMAPQRTPHDV